MTIHQKLVEIQKKLPSVKKNGFNKFNNYTYVTEADVLAVVGPMLADAGIHHCISVVSADVQEMFATVEVVLTLTDTEDGGTLETRSFGHAQQKKDDKGVFKAITGASKYAYLKTFGLSTNDDPENETEEESEAKAQKGNGYKKPAPPKIDEKRNQVMDHIGILFSQHGFTRETFTEIPAIQHPEKATTKELEAALEQVLQAAKLAAEFEGAA